MAFTDLALGASLALLATSLGAAGVFGFKRISCAAYSLIISFCAGVMAFSAVEMLAKSQMLLGTHTAVFGFAVGFLSFFVVEKILPHAHMVIRRRKMPDSKKKAALMTGTITIHNIPEGFAIASAFAGSPTLGWLVATSIALQDIPEGLVISAPLVCYGVSTRRSFALGVFSGIVEFAAALLGYILLRVVTEATPFALAFSSGAMSFVVVSELLPDALRSGERSSVVLCLMGGLATAFALASVLGF